MQHAPACQALQQGWQRKHAHTQGFPFLYGPGLALLQLTPAAANFVLRTAVVILHLPVSGLERDRHAIDTQPLSVTVRISAQANIRSPGNQQKNLCSVADCID
jgi:hypothetical protein